MKFCLLPVVLFVVACEHSRVRTAQIAPLDAFAYFHQAEDSFRKGHLTDCLRLVELSAQLIPYRELKNKLQQLWISAAALGDEKEIFAQQFRKAWGFELSNFAQAERVSGSSYLSDDQKAIFVKSWYRHQVTIGSPGPDPIEWANKLGKVYFVSEFGDLFQGRNQYLFLGFSAFLRRDHKQAIKNLNAYLETAHFDLARPDDLLALDARIKVYGFLRIDRSYDRPYFNDINLYIRVLKKRQNLSVPGDLEKLSELQFRLARYLTQENKLESVAEVFKDILFEFTGNTSLFAQQSRYQALVRGAREVFAARGDFGRAIENLKLAESEIGGDLECLANLKFYQGFYFLLNHQEREAIAIFETNGDLFQNNKNYILRVRYWKARALEQGGNTKEALEIYRQLMTDSPTDYYGQISHLHLNLKKLPVDSTPSPPEVKDFPLPKSWDWQKPLQFAQAERLLEMGSFADARIVLASAEQEYPPSGDEKNYALYFADLLNKDHLYLETFKILSPIFIPEFQKVESPALRLYYPQPYIAEFQKSGLTYQIEPDLLFALARQESYFDDKVISFDFGYGILQVQAETAEKIAAQLKYKHFEKTDLLHVSNNISFASFYLKQDLNFFRGNISSAVAAYNAGRPIVQEWIKTRKRRSTEEFIEDIPFEGTCRHVKNILKNRANNYLIYQQKFPASYFVVSGAR